MPEAPEARILGTRVPPLFPAEGPIRVMLYGEAPGPRGADQSGIPFWGDRAGQVLYRALEAAGLATVPAEAWDTWDGAVLKARGLAPTLRGAVLGNAWPACLTDNGRSFRAPKDRELRDPANLARISDEVKRAAARCPGRLRVIAMGRRAEWVFGRLEGVPELDFHGLPHPSAQGLLQAAPDKGRGQKLSDLQAAWGKRLQELLEGKA